MANIEFFGTAELIRKLEQAGHDVERAVIDAVKMGAEKPKSDMLNVIKQHRLTGTTENSFREELNSDGNTITYKAGFSIKDGGLPALFLNLGLPRKIQPQFFIDKAVSDNVDEIKRLQLQALQEAFKDV